MRIVTAAEPDGLRKRAAGGAQWTASAAAVNALIGFVQTAVLAHLLAPQDFGLASMAAVVVAFAQLFSDAGVSSAIIYRREPTAHELSSLYWFNVVVGFAIFGALSLATPVAASLFNEPKLEDPLRLAMAAFLIAPFGQQFQFLLQKELRFRSIALISLCGYAANLAVAIALAANGAGVYSLIVGQLTNTTVRTILLIASRRQVLPALHFSRRDLAGYLGFGAYQMGDKAANFFNAYLLHGLIGSMLGSHVLGIYTLAFELAFKPLEAITPIVTRVAFPVLARIREDKARVRRGYMSMLGLLSMVNFPIALGTAAAAPVLVPAIYGDAWSAAIPLVEILALVSLLRSSGSPVGALMLGLGKANWGFWWSAGKTVLQAPVLYVGISLNAAFGAACAYLILQALYSTAAYRLLIRNLLGPCLREYLRSFAPALIVACAVGFVVRAAYVLTHEESQAAQLAAVSATGVLTYVVVAFVAARPIIGEVIYMVRSRK
jgi:O-antigen/teichoic acid export membrane protein